MNEDMTSDNEDTISVPVPVLPTEPEEGEDPQRAEEEIQEAERDLADVQTAMEIMGRTLAVTVTAFEELKRIVFGDEQAITHAWPDATEKLPCCGRRMIDVPLSERISIDGSGVTCRNGAQ